MDKREAELLNAAQNCAGVLEGLFYVIDREGRDFPKSRKYLEALEAALRNYVPPITSEPGFDARDNSSLGMRDDFGMGEGRS